MRSAVDVLGVETVVMCNCIAVEDATKPAASSYLPLDRLRPCWFTPIRGSLTGRDYLAPVSDRPVGESKWNAVDGGAGDEWLSPRPLCVRSTQTSVAMVCFS